MKVSELLADLENRHQNAQVLVVERDAADNVLTIESVMKEGNEKAVMLMGRSAIKPGFPGTFVEALHHGADRGYNMKIYESTEQPGRFQINVDGLSLSQKFETQADAKLFIQGFTFGFSAGSGANPATAVDRS